DRLRIAVGLRARVISRWDIPLEEVKPELRAAIAAHARDLAPDWLLLAGALRMRELRSTIEGALSSAEPPTRHAAAVALELLRDPAARPALERALAAAESRGDRILIERALDSLREER